MSSSASPPLRLAQIYEKIQWDWASVSEDFLISICRQVRLDARLGEILVTQIAKDFERLNPWRLNQTLQDQTDPQILPILCSFVALELNADPPRLRIFRTWKKVIEKNIPKANPQNFFINGGYPKPEQLLRDFQRSNSIFEKWGFHSDQVLLAKPKYPSAVLSKSKREEWIDHLLLTRDSLTVREYLASLDSPLNIRTAERDLAEHPRLKVKGYTRNRVYLLRKN